MTPTTYIVVALIGVTVGAALGIIGASWRSDRRIADLEAENLGLRNEVALAAGRSPTRRHTCRCGACSCCASSPP
jgi:hypothetical protein